MRKKLLVENDLPELSDFQKILLLNKGKLDYEEIEFIDSDGENYPNIIDVTKDGIVFNFDDLEQFLKFFFRETYGEGTDGEWDARNYDSMYYGNYDFGDECYNRSSDDWDEGYTLAYLCNDALIKLRELISIISPNLLKYFKGEGSDVKLNSEGELTEVLDSFFPRIEDDITEIDCNARQYMLSDEASEYIRDKFCDGLKPFGIENWTGRFNTCFGTYFISWSNLVQLYLYDGEFDGDVLDVLFNYLEKNFHDHPPVSYEIEYNIWDQKKYNDYGCQKYIDVIESYLEEAKETYHPKYMKEMGRLTNLQLFTSRKLIPGSKYYIKAISLDPETMKVKYVVSNNWGGDPKQGIATVDEVIAIATQPGLFDPMDFRVDPN